MGVRRVGKNIYELEDNERALPVMVVELANDG
jgi:hypothetical protein